MSAEKSLSGIHHITAIAASATENLRFYENVLGLRLVKQTVNFDDPYSYHLYYGDPVGSPGSIMTFFPWEKLPRGKTGAGMVTAIAFSIPEGAFDYWQSRLNINGVDTQSRQRFGDRVLQFEDPHGLSLELIETPKPHPAPGRSSRRESERYRIAGFHSATALLTALNDTESLLGNLMGMVRYKEEDNRYRFKMNTGHAVGQLFDVVVDPRAENGLQGSGTVHHVAFRAQDDGEQKYWQKALSDAGFNVTAIRDRKYFKSIYFHEPGGVLFEIATDTPGFTVDEPVAELGRHLKLPDQYEPMRSEIERRLPPLRSSGSNSKTIQAMGQIL
jgi:glyoxalase family protein